MNKTMVFAVVKNGELKSATAELTSLAQKGGGEIAGVLIGNDVARHAPALAKIGCDIQYVIEDENLEKFSVEGYASAMENAIREFSPDQVLMISNESSKALAPILAGKTNGGICTDVVGVEWKEDGPICTRNAYAGKLLQRQRIMASPAYITLRSGSLPAYQGDAKPENPKVIHSPKDDLGTKVREIIKQASQKIDLAEAKFIVGVGRGAKNREGVDFVEQFANRIEAAFGGSRATVDAGWVPKNCQIGQTGKIIAPVLYICVGISGAIQHMAGIGNSKVILAINTDEEAPIFEIADYGIVGDLFKILPVLEKEILACKNA